jgi:hypothetical protein
MVSEWCQILNSELKLFLSYYQLFNVSTKSLLVVISSMIMIRSFSPIDETARSLKW